MTNHEIIKTAYARLPEPDTFKSFSIRIPVWDYIGNTKQFSSTTQYIVVFYKGKATSGDAFWCFDQVETLKF